MITELDSILSLAKSFMAHRPGERDRVARGSLGHSARAGRVATRGFIDLDEKLMELSESVRELFLETLPSATTLRRISEVFDRSRAGEWGADYFGERFEICSHVAFLGWRQASRLGLDLQSQEWLRVSDALVCEPFAALECIQAFLDLPPELQTVELGRQLLGRGEDIFLALAYLRRNRSARPSEVLAGTRTIYEASREAADLPSEEREFFLGEAAWLAGQTARYLGSRSEASRWLKVAIRHFQACPSRDPLVSKVRLGFGILARDCHDYERAESEVAQLRPQFEAWRMIREGQVCRLIECLVYKETGQVDEARRQFEGLVSQMRGGYERDLFASALIPFAELVFKAGETQNALELLGEAATAAVGYPLAEAAVFMLASECQLELGNKKKATKWCQAAIAKGVAGGATSTLAYYRVWFADLLIRSDRVEEAHQELLLAIPVLAAEEMIPESLYAARLLSEIKSRQVLGLLRQDSQGNRR